MPTWPGSAPMIPPETPLLAGKPTVEVHSPAASYIRSEHHAEDLPHHLRRRPPAVR